MAPAQRPGSTHNASLYPPGYLFLHHTFGQPWINPEWLAEIPHYLAFRLFAERGVFLVMIFAVDLIIAGVLVLCYRRSGQIAASWLATWIAVLLAAINIGPRTILFGWLCFLAEMQILEAFRRGRDHLWLLVHRIRAMDPTPMANADYSRDCFYSRAFP